MTTDSFDIDATSADDVMSLDDAKLLEIIRQASEAKPRSVGFYAELSDIGTENIARIAKEAEAIIGVQVKRGRRPAAVVAAEKAAKEAQSKVG